MLEIKVNANDKEKYCSKCGEVLEKDYKQGYCRTCKAEYNQKYVEDNKEHLNEYQKQYREDNKEHYKEYQKQYYRDNIANKKFIYFIESDVAKILYIGSCKSKYRVIYHLKCQTHLELNPKNWIELRVKKVRYIDVTEIVKNDDERKYIEKLYVDMYKPFLNSADPILSELKVEVMERLEDIVYNEYVEFEEIDIKKTTSYDEEVAFNFKDLILK